MRPVFSGQGRRWNTGIRHALSFPATHHAGAPAFRRLEHSIRRAIGVHDAASDPESIGKLHAAAAAGADGLSRWSKHQSGFDDWIGGDKSDYRSALRRPGVVCDHKRRGCPARLWLIRRHRHVL